MRGVLKPNSSKNYKLNLLGLALLAFSTACSKSSNKSATLADLSASQVKPGAEAERDFETEDGELRVLSRARFEQMIREGQVRRANPNAPAQRPEELLIGFPKSALGKEHLFGGVITATDDKENEERGGLKLTDLTPFHVYPNKVLDPQTQTSYLMFQGCAENCKPGFTDRENIMGFPISGEDTDKVYVDFAKIGSDLNLVEMMDPDGEYLHLKGVSASTVQVSYSNETLLFDVLGIMEEMPATAAIENLFFPNNPPQAAPAGAKQVSFTTRWYLKRRHANVNFKGQVATEGVGFFMTERFQQKKVHKHAHLDAQNAPLKTHYFLKNIPEEFKATFKQALEDWNDVFEAKIGARILTYEFVDANDPLASDLVAGDPRVNVLEWDLVNKAGYGGLGPSIADQETGAMVTANVLVQGPEIVKIYTEWFQVNREAAALREIGEEARADEVLKDARNRLFDERQAAKNGPKFALALNGKYKFNVNSQDPRLQDAAATKLDFEVIPAGLSYEQYMSGYFRELVAHELGHNMGLRHNFRGNLFAKDDNSEGNVSASIMEYLSRPYRHKNRIAAYDHMAIDYGYNFKTPAVKNQFCTDENVGNINKHTGSAECSRDDADNNPFKHLADRFARTRDLYVGKGTAEAPVWTKDEMLPNFAKYGDGVLLYGESAQRGMNTWIRFFEAPGRPAKNVEAVKSYVAKTLADIACDPSLEATLEAEKGPDSEASKAALENLNEFRKLTQNRVSEVLGATLAAQVNCVSAAQ